MSKNTFFAAAISGFVLSIGTALYTNAQSMNTYHSQKAFEVKSIFLSLMDTMMFNMDKKHPHAGPAIMFIEEMIPHHQGAIEMAKIEISKGQNFEMIQLAKSILVEQTNEIARMQLLSKQITKSEIPVNVSFQSAMNKVMESMMNNMPASSTLKDIDNAFASVMIPHHQAAIDMAKQLFKYSSDTLLTPFVAQLISNEQIEIGQMAVFIKAMN